MRYPVILLVLILIALPAKAETLLSASQVRGATNLVTLGNVTSMQTLLKWMDTNWHTTSNYAVKADIVLSNYVTRTVLTNGGFTCQGGVTSPVFSSSSYFTGIVTNGETGVGTNFTEYVFGSVKTNIFIKK